MAQWLEDLAAASEAGLQDARVKADRPQSPEFRRIEEDVLIQIGLGRFFAKKLRSAMLWEIWQKTSDASVGAQAVAFYKEAREAWGAMAAHAVEVYRADIGYGSVPMRRGCWMDRVPAINADIAAMQAKIANGGAAGANLSPEAKRAVEYATGKPSRPSVPATHTPAESFVAGAPLDVVLELGKGVDADDITVRLRYRHVDQAERWQWLEMDRGERSYRGTIPEDYTHSAFPLEYLFELKRGNEAWMYPGFNATLSNQPYFAVWKRSK